MRSSHEPPPSVTLKKSLSETRFGNETPSTALKHEGQRAQDKAAGIFLQARACFCRWLAPKSECTRGERPKTLIRKAGLYQEGGHACGRQKPCPHEVNYFKSGLQRF